MTEKKQKYAYWMYPSMVAEIEEMLYDADAQSKSEFVCMAVNFFIGYLRSQKNVNYLAPILAGAIKNEVQSLEDHLSEMLFKLAVEVAKSNHLIAATNTFSDDTLERLNGKCCRDVALNNGRITFENAYRYQHSPDDGDEN